MVKTLKLAYTTIIMTRFSSSTTSIRNRKVFLLSKNEFIFGML
ncbi:3683_t:CDS:2 [Cetraspora pellucida]|uniref:3683_t:CDS:1 n=1 Tax=Cetraspora pellucida TaxID=1433469 RepID=A0ACA9JYA1_9GLOM|nr:3683_t:CDS:2 [Cetraspora pellucida]